MSDLISRQAAIDGKFTTYLANGVEIYPVEAVPVDYLKALPSAHPEMDEWCTDCKEYDSERHCCPRFNRVIREALAERKTGRWILKPNIYGVAYCSECDYELHTNNTNYCPNCGARMSDGE